MIHGTNPTSFSDLSNSTTLSVIFACTERMLVDFGKTALIGEARKQPEKFKMDQVRTDNLVTFLVESND